MQITGFAILCAVLKRRATRPLHYLALFAIFRANFAFDVLGAGFPTIIAMNTPHPSTVVMWLSSFASIGLAATSLWWTAQLLLHERRLSGERDVVPLDGFGTLVAAEHSGEPAAAGNVA